MTDKIIDEDAFENIGEIAHRQVEAIRGEHVYRGGQITEAGVYAGVGIERYHHDPDLFDGFSISSSGLRALLRVVREIEKQALARTRR